jgi:hypothetical protein
MKNFLAFAAYFFALPQTCRRRAQKAIGETMEALMLLLQE